MKRKGKKISGKTKTGRKRTSPCTYSKKEKIKKIYDTQGRGGAKTVNPRSLTGLYLWQERTQKPEE